MKSTEHFKKTILAYLDKRALEDQLFAAAYQKPGKDIEDCITYILNEVKKSGCNGFATVLQTRKFTQWPSITMTKIT